MITTSKFVTGVMTIVIPVQARTAIAMLNASVAPVAQVVVFCENFLVHIFPMATCWLRHERRCIPVQDFLFHFDCHNDKRYRAEIVAQMITKWKWFFSVQQYKWCTVSHFHHCLCLFVYILHTKTLMILKSTMFFFLITSVILWS